MADVAAFTVDQTKRFHSATHEEIASGATADIYFIKTLQVLQHLGLADKPVTAELFPRRAGVLAGVEECRQLLEGKGVRVWSLPEGAEFGPREVVMRIEGPYGTFGLYETALFGMLASASGWATAARTAKDAAGTSPSSASAPDTCIPAVAPVMERAAMIGGCGRCRVGPRCEIVGPQSDRHYAPRAVSISRRFGENRRRVR